MKHELPPLPYEKDQLEPFLSREAVEIHYEKHHAGYVKKLNDTLADAGEYESLSLEALILEAPVNSKVFNFASQIWNHTFFWNCIAPGAMASLEEFPSLHEAVQQRYGSVENMREQFIESAKSQFGSGWTWLVKNPDGTLDIRSTSNAESVLRDGLQPLLICDVWEHAYYVDYRNERPRFVEEFMNRVNWEFVAANFAP